MHTLHAHAPLFQYQCSFMEFRNYKLVYRRYASLYFIVGIDDNEVMAHVFV